MASTTDKMGRPIVVVTGLGVVSSLGAGKTDFGDEAAGFLDGGAAAGAEQAGGDRGALEVLAEEHVAQHRQVREDRIALEHHTAIGTGFGNERRAIDGDSPLGRGLFAARDYRSHICQ